MIARVGLTTAILAMAAVAVGWNARGMLGHERAVRAKNLDFLPSPVVARALSCGHPSSASRLRWIDAFAYFQFQLDRKDDTIAGGGSGFKRLYDMLIGLDPRFEPYYQHAALCLGGVLERHQDELGYLQRGTLELPQASGLWRSAAAVLVTYYAWDAQQPRNLDRFLAAWADSETDDNAKAMVWQWQRALARRRLGGLEQVPYWLDRLPTTVPDSPMSAFIEGILREQIARYAIDELSAVLAARQAAGEPVERIADLLDAPRLATRQLHLQLGPVAVIDGMLALRSDPFGYPYQLRDGRVSSLGLDYRDFAKAVAGTDTKLQSAAKRDGGWPKDLDGVAAVGVLLPTPPPEAEIDYRGQHLIARIPDPPASPLTFR